MTAATPTTLPAVLNHSFAFAFRACLQSIHSVTSGLSEKRFVTYKKTRHHQDFYLNNAWFMFSNPARQMPYISNFRGLLFYDHPSKTAGILWMPSEWTPELSIVSETNTCSIDSVLLENIKQNENVKRAYGRMFAYDVPVNIDGSNHKANVISYEANQFKWSADYLTAGSISIVEQEENQVLVVNTENTDVRVGDVITLSINGKEQAVTVAGILSDSPLAREEGTETIFCSEKTFVALTGQTGYTIIDVQFQNGASIEDVKDIENIFTDGGVVFTEQLSQVQQQRNLYSAFAVLVYGFLSIIVAITIFHIMNTINMGVIAKTKQYGAMRAIGMSNQQLIKMIVAEAMTYAVSGMILGCIIGLPMHWVVFASLITNFWGTAWSIPIFPLALIIGIVLFTSFLAVRSPAKRLHDMAIVDTIKSQQ